MADYDIELLRDYSLNLVGVDNKSIDLSTVSNTKNSVFTSDLYAQKVRLGLSIFKPEWFRNTEYGIPYDSYLSQDIAISLITQEFINFLYKAFIFIIQINEINVTVKNSILEVQFTITVENGETLEVILSENI